MCGCLSSTPLLGTWPATQACALMGNQTGDPLVRRPALNPLSHTSQGSTIDILNGITLCRKGLSYVEYLASSLASYSLDASSTSPSS